MQFLVSHQYQKLTQMLLDFNIDIGL